MASYNSFIDKQLVVAKRLLHFCSTNRYHPYPRERLQKILFIDKHFFMDIMNCFNIYNEDE